MNTPPREKHLGFLINDVARLLRRAFDQRSQDCGMTRAQWQVLAYLFHNEGTNQASVAEALDVEPITLSRHIDRLEALGFVSRLPDPTDRRARRLYLTKAVQPQLDAMKAIGMEVLSAALEGVSDDETDRMIEVLSRMRSNMAGRGIETVDEPAPVAPGRNDKTKKALT
ncbi:MarR family transcriptional regulator [Kaistia dalseonensis]|uniref:DNA-binding MarR family transcriptional regulator n=1 Tax=Kaistia dalseonensis TaxID=410840 RepID=A0ABU0HB32_9HYPH|nr:MarR family transcriptional regulator [Kaistia dalseonensis]MCX5496892.1 MarR family transcriptional regulator [Kaistia dalseonensis]MDQ0439518.1 DNA-binding MarR family transcriptional regulator [Kaistia dalseonensis]